MHVITRIEEGGRYEVDSIVYSNTDGCCVMIAGEEGSLTINFHDKKGSDAVDFAMRFLEEAKRSLFKEMMQQKAKEAV